MSSPLGTPKPPVGGDLSTGTFEQVLFSTTGYGPDLHAILDTGETAGAGWFIASKTAQTGGVQTDGQSGGSGYSYHAWDKWYIAVDRDNVKSGNWDTGIGDIDELVGPLNSGKIGLLDVHRLRDAKTAVDNYVTWLATNQETIQQWINKLTSDDSAFKGKAAHAIRENLTKIRDTIKDLHTQITVERKTPANLEATATALETFAKGMANVWNQYSGGLKFLVTNTMTAVVNNVHTYIVGKGLAHGTPNYVLDILVSDSRERAEAYINEVVNGYSSTANTGPLYTLSWNATGGNHYAAWTWTSSVSQTGTYNFTPSPLPEGFPALSGPLGSAGTWDTFNKNISDFVRKKLEPLDLEARNLVTALQTAYEQTKKPLEELETPITLPPGGGPGAFPPPGGNLPPPGGNLPPPPGGGGNIPPPGGGGNVPPPGGGNIPPPGGGNIPPPGGTGNVPPPGGGNVPPPGGIGNVPPPGGGGEIPPPGGAGNQPPGAGGPFDTTSLSNTPPGGAGGPNGNGPGVPPPILPPSLSNLPPGAKSGPGPTGIVDGNGNPIDANGNLVDANGNPIDEFGNPIDPATGTSGNQPPGMQNLGLDDFPGGGSNPGGDFSSQSGEFGNSPPGAGFGDFPGGNSNLPGDFPGGNSNLPGDFPGGESNRNGDFSNLPGDFSNLPNGRNGDFGNLPGDFSNQPPGGTSNLPGGNGDFGNLPGGGDFGNLPGGGPGGTSNLPDFGNLPGGGGGGAGGGGAPGGDFSNLPGGGGAGGGGLGGGGLGSGAGGGAGGFGGGFGGEGWSDWSGQGPETQNGGSPFGGPTSGQPHGGMPMMPPMMPPMNGGGGDSKERERQTWLSEDDKIWGTDSDAGVGVIGLPNDVIFESEEPLAPTHVHVSSAAPRSKPEEKQSEQSAEQTATS